MFQLTGQNERGMRSVPMFHSEEIDLRIKHCWFEGIQIEAITQIIFLIINVTFLIENLNRRVKFLVGKPSFS
jgi:hypothetical protein